MNRLRLGITMAGLLLAACASDPYQSLYQGIQMRNEMGKTPAERANSPRPPSYDQYKKERDQQEQ